MKRNVKINTAKLLASTLLVGASIGCATDLAKDFGSTAISSIASVFEPVEVYASEQEVQVGDFVLKFDTSTGKITKYVSGEGHLEIPEKINGVAVKFIGSYAFTHCSSLMSVSIPNSVTSIGEDAFSGCSGLTSITIPNSVTSIGERVFSDCDALISINVDSSNPNYTFKDGVLFSKDMKTLVSYLNSKKDSSYVIPDGVTSIGDSAFHNCEGLTSITIPDSITSIGIWTFSGCTGLTSITIPNSVTSIGDNAFFGCEGLTSINIPNSVTSIGVGTFSNCNGLTSINIPTSVTSIGEYAFLGCVGLTSINIPNSVTSIGDGIFFGCTGLTSINLPASVTSIGVSTFSSCEGLTSINVDSSNPNYISKDGILFSKDLKTLVYYPGGKVGAYTIPNSVTSIGETAFRGCNGLTSITIPNSVTSIRKEAFSGCIGLTSITIPSSVTSIGSFAFAYCFELIYITIPTSVTSIGGNVLEWSLPKDIYYSGTESQWNEIDKSMADIHENITIHYNSTMPSTGSSSPSNQPPSAPKVDGINFKIGQTTSVMDVAPYVENGNTMIPVRAMATLLGISDDKIIYDSATNKVTITYYERVISLTIGDNKLYVTENGTTTTKTMDNNATAVTKDWRTFVPVRALSEAFGLQVGWDNDTQTVTLKS